MYDTMDRAAVVQYTQSAKQTQDSYRDAYDANAVSELTARRRTTEAIANSNLANSGLNSTQQTAISLSRSRADTQVTQQKQAAVDAIMRELDTVRAQYRMEAATKTADIQSEADADKSAYRTSQQEAAQAQALDLYEFEQKQALEMYKQEQQQAQKELELRYKYGDDVLLDEGAVFLQANKDVIYTAKTQGQKAAIDHIEQLYADGTINAEQRAELRTQIGVRETEPMSDSHLVAYTMRICRDYGGAEATNYLDQLFKAGVISYDKYSDMCKAVAAYVQTEKKPVKQETTESTAENTEQDDS